MASFQDIYLLQNELASLQSDATVRSLLASVVQDAQSETVDMEKSRSSIASFPITLPNKLALFKIRNFLQNVIYCWHAVQDLEPKLFDSFLFENCTRLQKLLLVAKFLDHANLMSFGTKQNPVHPAVTDIPTYAYLWNVLLEFRQTRHASFMDEHQRQIRSMDRDFLFFCPEQDYEAFKARNPELAEPC